MRLHLPAAAAFVFVAMSGTACSSWVPVHHVADAAAAEDVRAVMPDGRKVMIHLPDSDQVEELLKTAKNVEVPAVDGAGVNPAIPALFLVLAGVAAFVLVPVIAVPH